MFGPALFIGAALGGILCSLLVEIGLPTDYGSIITIATLAAVGSSVIGAPITVVLIIVELTGSYEYGLMALLSVTLCSTLTYRFFGLSFFDRQLLDRGIDLTRGREHIYMTQRKIIMTCTQKVSLHTHVKRPEKTMTKKDGTVCDTTKF